MKLIASSTIFVAVRFLALLLADASRAAFIPSKHIPALYQRKDALSLSLQAESSDNDELVVEKRKLFSLLRVNPIEDTVLADPVTKEGLVITNKGAVFGGAMGKVIYQLKSSTNSYSGSSDSFIDLLEPMKDKDSSSSNTDAFNNIASNIMLNLTPVVPRPLLSVLSNNFGLKLSSDYVPMRDFFTLPTVSYGYERGWRQSFARAGFPGPDIEADMAMDYFDPIMAENDETRVLVDMSCATGLLTRRFVKSGKYKRVIGCDYSASMLEQGRQFIDNDIDLRQSLKKTQLDLVRLDVGQIPMKNESVDALHAGAAMHCWPDLPLAVSEIRRVLKPGGRYFATTFLTNYFYQPSQQTFQSFQNAEELKSIMVQGGFSEENVLVEVLGKACVVIRCEK